MKSSNKKLCFKQERATDIAIWMWRFGRTWDAKCSGSACSLTSWDSPGDLSIDVHGRKQYEDNLIFFPRTARPLGLVRVPLQLTGIPDQAAAGVSPKAGDLHCFFKYSSERRPLFFRRMKKKAFLSTKKKESSSSLKQKRKSFSFCKGEESFSFCEQEEETRSFFRGSPFFSRRERESFSFYFFEERSFFFSREEEWKPLFFKIIRKKKQFFLQRRQKVLFEAGKKTLRF